MTCIALCRLKFMGKIWTKLTNLMSRSKQQKLHCNPTFWLLYSIPQTKFYKASDKKINGMTRTFLLRAYRSYTSVSYNSFFVHIHLFSLYRFFLTNSTLWFHFNILSTKQGHSRTIKLISKIPISKLFLRVKPFLKPNLQNQSIYKIEQHKTETNIHH